MPKVFLIIDDDPDDREFFREAIEEASLDVECIEAKGCFEGLAKLGEVKKLPDFIFLDFNMPKINGEKCLVVLKEKFPTIPICMYVTSKRYDEHILRQWGASKIIIKPNTYKEIAKSVKALLEESNTDVLFKL